MTSVTALRAPSWPAVRNWGLLLVSLAAPLLLQPGSPIRNLSLALPIVMIGLAALTWWIAYRAGRAGLVTALVVGLVTLLVVLKFEPAAAALSAGLRAAGGQNVASARASDVAWLGFSYVAFRLIHVLRDKAAGRLPPLDLREFMTYALFAPALVAGPIERAERFARELRAPWAPNRADMALGGQRVIVGVFRKFVLADVLALIALNPQNAAEVQSAGWAWILLAAYALRIYFDFAGYSDIAIGIARMFGIKLPENFDAPYLKPNLTTFWNAWHITLAQWFRAYWFNPLTRALRGRGWSVPALVLLGQLTTMALIGLWHGVTLNFLIWGTWHGLGLFAHNRWTEYARARGWVSAQAGQGVAARVRTFAGQAATFVFVALGWVWFALPDPATSLRVLARLVGA